jgi:hypothetical protein
MPIKTSEYYNNKKTYGKDKKYNALYFTMQLHLFHMISYAKIWIMFFYRHGSVTFQQLINEYNSKNW